MISKRTLALLFISLSALAEVKVTQRSDRVEIKIDDQPAIAFLYGPSVTKPYVYPLRASNGSLVTRGWPMDPRPGERHDHIHHRGIWFAHCNVNSIDFWNSDPSYHNPQMGHIVVTKIDRITSGADSGSVSAQMEWQDPAKKVLLHESRSMVFHSGNPRVIDFDFTLTAKERVTFGDDKDGVFGMRLAPELEETANDVPPPPVRSGQMTSSNGCHQEVECWGKRADWLDVSGKINDVATGVAVFDHPDNPRHPTYWHVRGYGLLANNVFGVKAFTKDAKADGGLTLEPGATLRFRYRVVIHSGEAQAADIASLYRAYTAAGSSGGLR